MASIIFFLLIFLPYSLSQSPTPPIPTTPTPPAVIPTTPTPPAVIPTPPSPPLTPPPPPPVSDACNGIFLSYRYSTGVRIPPREPTLSKQPYSFESEIFILNNDAEELKSWRIFVGFQHNEFLVSATNAILADGTSFPGYVSNGTVFSGFPSTDLMTAIETAGDLTQMSATIKLKGTQFGVAPPAVPMPSNISLMMDGYDCRNRSMQGTRLMNVCCVKDPNFKVNVTVEGFLPRQSGDLTIDYDVLRSYGEEYDAEVRIANHNALGRLDYWMLSWDWMREEFILEMKGAHPVIGDTNECLFGSQGQYYKAFDFSTIANCQRRPTIVDLPLDKTNDTTLGLVPFCCRNGTILPTTMDSSKSMSAFRMKVKKMPPDLNRTELFPPQNFQINGTLNPEYRCGPPIRVSPSQFPDPSGLPYNRTAVATWQVVCNITQARKTNPKCCVSFSSFYNDSVIPCRTCACGCPSNPSKVCSATTPALLLRPDALLVPFENRTEVAKSWAEIIHNPIPDPLPCGDNCGVSINWHVNTDYRGGWTARVTLFNWGETNFADWFAAMQFENAVPGFEKMYSFNATAMDSPNNKTIFMQGLEGLNYLMAEVDGANPSKDPRVPGKQQSVISFTKKLTPGINVVAGDGFPSKVFFNGEECSRPTVFPSGAHKTGAAVGIWSLLLSILVLVFRLH